MLEGFGWNGSLSIFIFIFPKIWFTFSFCLSRTGTKGLIQWVSSPGLHKLSQPMLRYSSEAISVYTAWSLMRNLTQDCHYFILAHLYFCVSSNGWCWCEKTGKIKPCGYLYSKLDVTDLFVFPNPRELARTGNFPCFEFLPLWSRTYQPQIKRQGCLLPVGPRLCAFPGLAGCASAEEPWL